MNAPPDVPRTLIDDLLAEQSQLTAVEQFARAHERHEIAEPRYRKLLPASPPRPGEQYAFEVDLDKCTGCKACVTACHSLNGLDDGEAWREVGVLHGEALVPCESGGNRVVPLQQIVTTACHHCVEPGCLDGCPVLAYEKDPLTGIVRHLDDQCIGCSYCILKCPYDVPKYSEKRGIVRKCDMCRGRLAAGEAPACVQACPNEAIRIGVVNQAEVREELRNPKSEIRKKTEARNPKLRPSDFGFLSEFGSRISDLNTWLPDSPSPTITLPTTRFITTKPAADLRADDHATPKPQPAHWPLIVMLILTQAGIGGLIAAPATGGTVPSFKWITLALLIGGLVASVFHIGQPLKAWRVWLGWRKSWLSREAIALNILAGVAVGVVASRLPPLTLVPVALAALFAQMMVYVDTHRHSWRLAYTAPRFLGTTVVLGLALVFAFNPAASLAVALLATSLLKLACELALLKHADSDSDRWTPLRRTATLQLGALRPVLSLRLLAGLAGGVFVPLIMLAGHASPMLATAAPALCAIAETAERYLFFTSVAPEKMPVP